MIVAIPAGEASALLSVHDIATNRNAMASNRLLDRIADLELDIFQTIIHIYLLQNTISSGLSFGHFNENSRQKKLKLKSEKLKTQEQKKPKTQGFSENTKNT